MKQTELKAKRGVNVNKHEHRMEKDDESLK
jgi:hypothetical protein